MKYVIFFLLFNLSLYPDVYLQFFKEGNPKAINIDYDLKGDLEKDSYYLIENLINLPQNLKEEGFQTAFPPSSKIFNIKIKDDWIYIILSIPKEDLEKLSVLDVDNINFQVSSTLYQLEKIKNFWIGAIDLEDGKEKILSYFLREPPIQRKTEEKAYSPPSEGQPQPEGSLSGKTIFLSAGHGWYYNGSTFTTQRGVNCDIVEDFENAEKLNYFLTRYLVNAGAKVVTARERDFQKNMVIVDNDGGNGASLYQEFGSGWFDSSLSAFANGYSPYLDGQNPFSFGTNRLIACTNGAPNAYAKWTPYITEDGYYSVYVSFTQYTNRAPDAHYVVKHSGGETHFRINQTIDGSTFRYLGTFFFYQGLNPDSGSVILYNDSSYSGKYISADAVRFGGGYGEIQRGETTSGKPKWEECCRYYAQYMGAPPEVYDPSTSDNNDDVTCRPRYSEWEKDSGEDGLYISWHSNALNGGCTTDNPRGTSTYVYTSPTPGSTTLQNLVHNELINDIRAEWESTWTDRGKLSADFGELRLLSTMPGVLIELAFHDNPNDANALKNPKFAQVAARAIYQGISKYYNSNATLLPETPTHLYGKNLGNGSVRIGWRVPPSGGAGGDPATGYKVYISYDGFSFQDGIYTTNAYFDLNNLQNGTLLYFRVSAINSGGESFPTETLAVKVGEPKVLIVQGYDRIDTSNLVAKSDTVGVNKRMVLEKMNGFNYIIEHSQSISNYGVAFDSSTNEAVRDGDISLLNYCALDWILGEESTADKTFDPTEQTIVQNYLSGGGNLFVSGSEIAWDLDYINNGRAFYNNYLKAIYLYDSAYTGTRYNIANGLSGTIFEGITNISFENGTGPYYYVDWPDVIGNYGGSIVNLNYQNADTPSISAGIQYEGSFKIVNIAFPFETILDASKRDEVMAKVLNFLLSGCGNATSCENPKIIPSFPYSDNFTTALGSQNFSSFNCDTLQNFSGPEAIYSFTINQKGKISVNLTGSNVIATLLSNCNWYSCFKEGLQFEVENLPVGTYYIVVDSSSPSPFTITVNFTPEDKVRPKDVERIYGIKENGLLKFYFDDILNDIFDVQEESISYLLFRGTNPKRLFYINQSPSNFFEDNVLFDGNNYFYRVYSNDLAGNTSNRSGEFIIDNTMASYEGNWNLASAQPDKYLSNYLYHPSNGDGSEYVIFRPLLIDRGNYSIYEWHPAANNRSQSVPHRIYYATGDNAFYVDQTKNGGKWNYISQYNFNAGNNGYLKISDDAVGGSVLIADAISFISLKDDFICDDEEATFTSGWWWSNTTPNYWGIGYYVASTSPTGTYKATFYPNLKEGGSYKVYTWYTSGTNRSNQTPYLIHHKNGTTTIYVDQQNNGSQWYYLGTFEFLPEAEGFVEILNQAPAGYVVIADAVKWEKVD